MSGALVPLDPAPYDGPPSLPFRQQPGDPDEPRQLTLPECYERFVLPISPDLAASTLSDHRSTLGFWQRCCGALPIGAIDEAVIARFREWLETPPPGGKGGGRSKSTVAKHLKNVRHILRICGPQGYRNTQGRGVIDRVPYVAVPGVKKRDRVKTVRVVPLEKIGRWYAAARHAKWPQGKLPPPLVWSTKLVLYYTYGLDPGDLHRLVWGRPHQESRARGPQAAHTHFVCFKAACPCPEVEASHEYGWLCYSREKTGVEVYLPLTAVARAHLELMTGPWSRVFPVPTRENSWMNERRRIQRCVAIDPPYTFHELRKTGNTAWRMFARDLGIAVLGHKEPGVNPEFYWNAIPKIIEHAPRFPYPPEMADGLCSEFSSRRLKLDRSEPERIADRQLRLF